MIAYTCIWAYSHTLYLLTLLNSKSSEAVFCWDRRVTLGKICFIYTLYLICLSVSEDKMPTLAKFMLTVYLGLFIYAYLRLLQGSDETTAGRYVSWNEFYHDMLAKGEVMDKDIFRTIN